MRSTLCGVTLMVSVFLCHSDLLDEKFSDMVVAALKQDLAESIKKQEKALTQEKMIAEINEKMSQLKEHIITLDGKDSRASSVMFSAYWSGGPYFPSDGEIIPFDQVALNSGNHFNTDTHKFVCPFDGIYFFSFSLHSAGIGEALPNYSSGHLVVDGTIVSTTRSYNNDSNDYIYVQSSASVLTQCSAGAEVLVESANNDNKIFGSSPLLLVLC